MAGRRTPLNYPCGQEELQWMSQWSEEEELLLSYEGPVEVWNGALRKFSALLLLQLTAASILPCWWQDCRTMSVGGVA